MTLHFAPFIVSLFFIGRLRKLSRIYNVKEEEKKLTVALFSCIILFIAQNSIPHNFAVVAQWIFNLFLLLLIWYAATQKKFPVSKMMIWAFMPFVVLNFVADIIRGFRINIHENQDDYIENILALSFIWMLALMFSQIRQQKNLEKEKIKRQQEDEVNRAIAIRKVELEGLVEERTLELQQQKDELQHALTDLQATQAQLIQSEKMASLGELTAGIAHEIQNPLNFVNNFAEVNKELLSEMKDEIEKGNFDEVKTIANDVITNQEKINHHGKRADAIVKGMLQHSRSSSGQKEPTDINALADEYLRLSYHGLRAKDKSFNAKFETHFDESLQKINVVPQDLGRVLLNLVNNAFYAVSAKALSAATLSAALAPTAVTVKYEPTVSITTKQLNNKIEIRVSDNGNGIPQNVLDKIFQPFFTTKPTGKGTGLGLSLSYDIVTKAHNGELKVETKENEGSTFIIYLPI